MKILFTYFYGEAQMASVKALGFEVDYIAEKDIAKYPDLETIEGLVCYNPFQTITLEQMPRLSHILLSSAGVDQVPKVAALSRGIVVTNNRGGYSKPIGEWVVWTILNIYKDSKYFIKAQNEGIWRLNSGIRELVDRRIGIIGTGSIGIACAKRLKGFEVTLVGFNTKGTDVEGFDEVYPIEALAEVLPELDVIVVSVPYTSDTHLLIDENKIGAMKEDSVFINVSRGHIVDEKALERAINQGKFIGIGLDVFQEEPLPLDHPFWHVDRLYVTPHNSWVSEMRNVRRFETIYENLKRLRSGEPLLNVIDISRGY